MEVIDVWKGADEVLPDLVSGDWMGEKSETGGGDWPGVALKGA